MDYQSGMPSPPVPSGSGVVQSFHEPQRFQPEVTVDLPETRGPFGIPRPLINSFNRVRNSLAVYNFFTIYCVNALLNVEIYREYMERHTAGTKQSIGEQLYIATLAAPLIDVLARIVARNYFKLNLAKAMSHVSFGSSLAICTPSLNTYALLILRGSGSWIPLILLMDISEIGYSLYMWKQQARDTEAMTIKLIFITITLVMFCWDVVALFLLRRFFDDLPRHIHPIYVCWDVNQSFHWRSTNSIFDIMEEHEDIHGPKISSAQSKAVRKKLAQWNQGEEHLEFLEQFASPEERQRQQRAGAAGGRGRHQEDEDEQVERRTLLAGRR